MLSGIGWRFTSVPVRLKHDVWVACWLQNKKASKTRSSSALFPNLFGGGFPTEIDYRKKGTLILTSLLEDLEEKTFKLALCLLHLGMRENR